MRARGSLKSLGQVETVDVIRPGDITPTPDFEAGVFDEANVRKLPGVHYGLTLVTPDSVTGVPGRSLNMFQTGQSFRRWGKDQIAKKLAMIPTSELHVYDAPGGDTSGIKQRPHYFVDGVPNFGEIEFGQAAPEPDTGVSRDSLGNIVSTLVSAATTYFGPQITKYEQKLGIGKSAAQPVVSAPIPWATYLLIGGAAFLAWKLILKRG